MTLHDLLSRGGSVVADGGMGTMLFSLGLEQGYTPELWNVEQPDKVLYIHSEYIKAGAQIILTNTFGGSKLRLESHGLGDQTRELNEAGAAVARQAADAAGHLVVVAGSIGPCGQFFSPLGLLTHEQGVESFAEQVRGLVAGGVDVLWVETMSDLQEVRAAVAACQVVAPDLPVVATMTFDTHGRTMMGTTPEQAVREFADMGLIACGGNCGNGPDEIEGVIEKMHAADPDAVLVAKSNAGLPRFVDGQTTYDATPDDMAAYARRVHEKGAHIVGACCGSTPQHIEAIARVLGVPDAQ